MKFYPEKLEAVRRKTGISVKYIVTTLAISRVTYWNWEKGLRNPSEDSVKKLAHLMGINCAEISDLVYEDEEKSTIFDNESIADKLLKNRSEELKYLQDKSIAVLKEVNSEINQVWLIVESIFKAINAVIYIKSTNNLYSVANKAFKELLSLKNNYNVNKKSDFDFFSKKNAKINSDEDLQILQNKKNVINEIRIIPWSKNKKWGLFSKHPIFDKNNNIAGVICIIEDITRLYELEGIRLLLEEAIKSSTDIFILRTKDEVLFVSDSGLKESGISSDSFYSNERFNRWLEEVHPEDREKEIMYINNFNYPKLYQYRIYDKNNELQWMEVKSVKIKFRGKEYYFRVHRNITKEKRLEFELVKEKKLQQINHEQTLLKVAKRMHNEGMSKELIKKFTDLDYSL